MKSTKTIVRIVAVMMLAAFSFGLIGCVNSYNTNPTVATIGSVKIDLKRFNSMYYNTDSSSNPYYSYMANGYITREQYANYIIEDLINYGVQMDQIKKQNIALDETEEAELLKNVDDNIKDYAVKTYSSKIDSSIKGTEEKAEACMEMLKKELKDNNASFEDYRKSIEESLRNNALIEKLRKQTVGDITVTNDDIKKYFEDNAKSSTVSAFKSALDQFLSNQSKALPLAMPHPEKAVEDDPDTEKDETRAENPYGNFFSIQHVLIKFTTEANEDDRKDLTAYAAQDADFTAKAAELEAVIPTLDSQGFLDKCHDKDVCDDPGMLTPVYQFFGYAMQEELISSYYDGFGYAAMKLRFGQDWEPKTDESSEPASTEAAKNETKDYKVEYFTLTDGAQVAKVYTYAGAHYIILNPVDCYCMYDEDGYLMLPLYDGDNLVTEGGNIVTAKGTMTQEQLDAANAALETVTKKAESAEEDDSSASKDDESADQEEAAVLDLKAIYDYYAGVKKSAMESETYAAKFSEWKDATSINVNRTLLKPYLQNG